MGRVYDSSIDLGKVLTVQSTSLTTLPWIDNCPPLGSSHFCINGIHGEINLSSKGIKFKHCGFTGNPTVFALENSGSFPLLWFEWQVEQIHFVLSTLVAVVIHALSNVSEYLGYLFASHFRTDDWYHIWLQQVPWPHLMLSWKASMTFIIFGISCKSFFHSISCTSLTGLQLGLLVARRSRSWSLGSNPDMKDLFLFCAFLLTSPTCRGLLFLLCLFTVFLLNAYLLSSLIWSQFDSLRLS